MDAVIVDMRLPGIDGNETVVRAHALQPSLHFSYPYGLNGLSAPGILVGTGYHPG